MNIFPTSRKASFDVCRSLEHQAKRGGKIDKRIGNNTNERMRK
jgi:hypothetical protein